MAAVKIPRWNCPTIKLPWVKTGIREGTGLREYHCKAQQETHFAFSRSWGDLCSEITRGTVTHGYRFPLEQSACFLSAHLPPINTSIPFTFYGTSFPRVHLGIQARGQTRIRHPRPQHIFPLETFIRWLSPADLCHKSEKQERNMLLKRNSMHFYVSCTLPPRLTGRWERGTRS